MGKKIVTLFTMVAFIIFSLSCYSTRAIKVETGHKLEGKELKIVKLQKKSGEFYEFSKKQSPQILRGIIIWKLTLKEYVVDKSDIKKLERGKRGTIINITTKDGKNLNVVNAREENEKIIIDTYFNSRIPLSEIDIIWVKKNNVLGNIVFLSLGMAVFFTAIFLLGGMQIFSGGSWF